MLEFSDKPVLQAKPSQNRLLWIGVSVIAILLFTIIFRLIRARAGKMLQPPQKANEVLVVLIPRLIEKEKIKIAEKK